MCLKKGLYRI